MANALSKAAKSMQDEGASARKAKADFDAEQARVLRDMQSFSASMKPRHSRKAERSMSHQGNGVSGGIDPRAWALLHPSQQYQWQQEQARTRAMQDNAPVGSVGAAGGVPLNSLRERADEQVLGDQQGAAADLGLNLVDAATMGGVAGLKGAAMGIPAAFGALRGMKRSASRFSFGFDSRDAIQSEADKLAARLNANGFQATVDHSGSKLGASSYVTVYDPQTKRFIKDPARFSGHSKGPFNNQMVHNMLGQDDADNFFDLAIEMRNKGPIAEQPLSEQALRRIAKSERKKLKQSAPLPMDEASRNGERAAPTNALAMDEASRMGRAAEQGITKDVYHGTYATDIDEMRAGDIGVHVGTFEQANNRLIDVGNKDSYSSYRGGKGYKEGANVLPLKANLGKSLEMPDVGQWNDSAVVLDELGNNPRFADRVDGMMGEADEIKRSFEDADDWVSSQENQEFLDEIKQIISDEGFDSVKYKNMAENKSSLGAGMTPRGYREYEALNKQLHELRSSAERTTRPELPNPSNATEADILKWLDDAAAFDAKTSLGIKNDVAYQAKRAEIRSQMDEVTARETLDEHSYIILDPKNIRSKFAAFDPKNKNSAKLLGKATPEMLGVVAAGSAAGVGYAAHEKKPKNALRKP